MENSKSRDKLLTFAALKEHARWNITGWSSNIQAGTLLGSTFN